MKIYLAIHKDADSSYGVTIPQVRGCFAAGESKEEAIQNSKNAVLYHAEALVDMRIPLYLKEVNLDDLKNDPEVEKNADGSDPEWVEIELENIPVFRFTKLTPPQLTAGLPFTAEGSNDLFGDPETTTNLAEIFRGILRDQDIREEELNERIIRYVTDDMKNPVDHALRVSIGNIKKELSKEDMSWKVFRKGLTILGYNKVEMKFS